MRLPISAVSFPKPAPISIGFGLSSIFAADANGMRLHAVKFDRSHRSSSSVGYKIALPILIYDGPILLHRQFRNVPSLTLLR